MCVFVMSTVIATGGTLKELNVGYNDIGDNGISAIAEGLQSNKTITKLDVAWCKLSVKGTVPYVRCDEMFKFNE